MTDLAVDIAGLALPDPLMVGSGPIAVRAADLLAFGQAASAIVTKSMTVEAREGNPLPRYYGFPGGSINSMGLPNLGYRAYAELIPELKQFGKPVIAINTATYWYALRQYGIKDKVRGWGSLLAEH